MLNKISKQFARLLVKKTENGQQMEEVYVYGLELILSTALGFFSILFLSAMLQELISGVVFICFFSPLRMFVGGYHADTYGKCFFISNISYLIVLLLKEVTWKYISLSILFFVLFVIIIYIFRKAPLINENQNISNNKQIRSRKIARIILIIQFTLICYLSDIHRELMCMAVLSVYLVALFMLVADKPVIVRIQERRKL